MLAFACAVAMGSMVANIRGYEVRNSTALGACRWCEFPEWKNARRPTLNGSLLDAGVCHGESYDWAVFQSMDKGGILNTYYHFVLEFAVPLLSTAWRLHREIGGPGVALLSHPEWLAARHVVKKWPWLDLLPNETQIRFVDDPATKEVCVSSRVELSGEVQCSPLSHPQHRLGFSAASCRSIILAVGQHAIGMLGVAEASPRLRRDSPIRVLFIPREHHIAERTRKILNWDAVVKIIANETMCVGAELKLQQFVNLQLPDQLAALHSADVVITQRGSVNASFLVLRPETRVILLADPMDYDPFIWIGPMWYATRIVHIRGGNFDPFGVVDAPALQRTLAQMLAEIVHEPNLLDPNTNPEWQQQAGPRPSGGWGNVASRLTG